MNGGFMNIEKAKKQLDSMAAKTKRMGGKRADIEALKENILSSLQKNSLRQVHSALKASGFTGSLSILHAAVKEWKHTCPGCCKSIVKRREFKKTPGEFYWQCGKCGMSFYDKKGTYSGTQIQQKSKQKVEQKVNNAVNDTVNNSANTSSDKS